MRGLMIGRPFKLQRFVDSSEQLSAEKHFVSSGSTGVDHAGYGEYGERSSAIAAALDELGIGIGQLGHVAIFDSNRTKLLERNTGTPCLGLIVHKLIIRQFTEQLEYNYDDLKGEVKFADALLVEMLFPILSPISILRRLAVMGGWREVPFDHTAITVLRCVDLFYIVPFVSVKIDRNDLARIRCLSEETGFPRGVESTHRPAALHVFGLLGAACMGVPETDTILPAVRMFHANELCIPHPAVAVGVNLVLLCPNLSGSVVTWLIADVHLLRAAGVPTNWMGVLPVLRRRNALSLDAILCGCLAVPKTSLGSCRPEIGPPIQKNWGRIEIYRSAIVDQIQPSLESILTYDQLVYPRSRVGQQWIGVRRRIVNDASQPIRCDGSSQRNLEVWGPWIASGYFTVGSFSDSATVVGCLRKLEATDFETYGFVRPVDWTKSVIESGGEWISSVEPDNERIASSHGAEDSVVGVPDPQWDESSMGNVVRKISGTFSAGYGRRRLEVPVTKRWLSDGTRFSTLCLRPLSESSQKGSPKSARRIIK